MAETLPDILTIEEVSRYLRMYLPSLDRLAQANNTPSQKVGKHWHIRRKAIQVWK